MSNPVAELTLADLLSANPLQPLSARSTRDRRRRCERIRCMHSGTLTWSGRRYTVQSQDASRGGIRVLSLNRANPPVGSEVFVQIKVGAKVFGSTCRVVAVHVVPDGSLIRLAHQADPAGA